MSSSLYGGGGMSKSMSGLGGGDVIPSGYRKGQLSQFTPEQTQLFKQMFSHVGPDSYLSRLAGGDEDIFNEIEAPEMRKFNDLQSGIANRFSGAGTGGRKSSGFQNATTAASSNFSQDLASRRQGLQQQAIKDLMGMSSDLLGQRPYDKFLTPKRQEQEGFDWGGLGGAALGGIGGFFAGGPVGALSGASLGYGIGSGRGSSGNFTSSPGWGQKKDDYNFLNESQNPNAYQY